MRKASYLLITLLALAAQPGRAEEPAAAEQGDPRIPHKFYKLDNGLEVILIQDKSVPLVAVSIWYHVGSGDETPGKSGFAHLFEHMMFQGAKHIGRDVHFDILKQIGASNVNGTTNTDRTNYFEVVPSHQLEVALWLESDRMGYLLDVLDDQALSNQRDVVRNERRQRYDNVPYGKDRFEVAKVLYPEGHPYRYLTIGKHEDVEGGSLEDVRTFFKTWYVPANATLAIAGDFEVADAEKLVAKWFGSFPRSERPSHRAVKPTPIKSQVVQEFEDEFAKLPRLHWVWHSPVAYGAGEVELEVLAHALGNPGTGRLYRKLVLDEQLARSVSVWQNSQQLSGIFHVIVDLKADADEARAREIVETELAAVTSATLEDKEIRRAVIAVESGFVWGLEGLMQRAELLQQYNHYVGKPDYAAEDLARYRAVKADGVRKVAAQYLAKKSSALLISRPKKESK